MKVELKELVKQNCKKIKSDLSSYLGNRQGEVISVLLDKITDLQKEVNDKNILIFKPEKAETYPLQITKSPCLKNVTSKTNVSQYSDTPALCQNLNTPIKPGTNSDSNKGDTEFIKGKLETQLMEFVKPISKII